MSDERIEVEKREEPVVNKDRKKKKRIVTIIITAIVLLIIAIVVICVVKYRADNRYIPYEGLEKEQIIIMQVYIEATDEGKSVLVRAISSGGDLYCTDIAYNEWIEKIEALHEIEYVEAIESYKYDTDMKIIYDYATRINETAEFKTLMSLSSGMRTETYSYVIRYRENGEVEVIKFWEDRVNAGCYILEDSASEEIYKIVGGIL